MVVGGVVAGKNIISKVLTFEIHEFHSKMPQRFPLSGKSVLSVTALLLSPPPFTGNFKSFECAIFSNHIELDLKSLVGGGVVVFNGKYLNLLCSLVRY